MTGIIDQRLQHGVGGFGGVDGTGAFDPGRGGNGYETHNYNCYHHVRVSDAAILDYRNNGIDHLFLSKQDGSNPQRANRRPESPTGNHHG